MVAELRSIRETHIAQVYGGTASAVNMSIDTQIGPAVVAGNFSGKTQNFTSNLYINRRLISSPGDIRLILVTFRLFRDSNSVKNLARKNVKYFLSIINKVLV